MFRKIQKAGRSLQIICPPEQVLPLCGELRPEGLAFWMETALPPDKLDRLFELFCSKYS